MDQIFNMDSYAQQSQNAFEDPARYWSSIAKNLHWFKTWDNVCSGDFNNLDIKWFEGSKTNLSYNCLDRHLENKADETALIYVHNDPSKEKEEISFQELHQRVVQMGALFKKKGIKKGDRVCFYMGMTPELMIGILACTRIGAVHSVVFVILRKSII